MARCVAFAATVPAVAWSGAAEGAQRLQPHEAVYDIAVKEWRAGGAPDGFRGRAVIRVSEGCENWTTEFGMRIGAILRNGRDFAFSSSTRSLENKAATALAFTHKININGRSTAELNGTVSRPAAGAAGRIRWTKPEPVTGSLPAGVLFPMESFFKSVGQIEAGQKALSYRMFDGSDIRPARVFELITGVAVGRRPNIEGDADLLNAKAWRVTGSFFDDRKEDAEPTTTFVQVFHVNGIAGFQQIDTGFATLDLNLKRLNALKRPAC